MNSDYNNTSSTSKITAEPLLVDENSIHLGGSLKIDSRNSSIILAAASDTKTKKKATDRRKMK